MKNITYLLLLLAELANAQTFNPQLATMLQDTLNHYTSLIANVKGMSASVYIPGQGIWQGTSGVSYTGQPITPNMGFGIASNTKLFVAVTILKLCESNLLQLDDSLHKWLPSYPNINPNITIRQLLNHTSGVSDPLFVLPYVDTIANNPTRIFTPNEVLSWVGAPMFSAGTGWGYSNTNYILAGMVAQSVTGQHISELIRSNILTPLQLDSTFYDVEESEMGLLAHRWYNGVDYNDTSRVGLNTAGGAAGSLFSTSREMAQWYHALFSGQILNAASMANLTTFVATPTAYTYGLGLENQAYWGRTIWGHGGSTWGYKSRMVYDPCNEYVVCGLANSWPAGMDGITLILYKVLVDVLPGCPSAILGDTLLCQNQNNATFSIAPITHATSYIWTLPNGFTGISNSNSITVNVGNLAVSGYITVKGVNSYGSSGTAKLALTVYPTPVISGISSVCNNSTVNYSVPAIAGSTYTWTATGATILSGQGTNQILVLWNNGTAGTVSVVRTVP